MTPKPRRRRPRVMYVRVEMRIEHLDQRMTGHQVSEILEKHFWLLADELTGLLTYGGGPVSKPEVQVTAIVVREE